MIAKLPTGNGHIPIGYNLCPDTQDFLPYTKAMAGGGPLMDIGIYCVQSNRYTLGEEPVSVTAQFGPVTNKLLF
jgi:predicted dehydrogenase